MVGQKLLERSQENNAAMAECEDADCLYRAISSTINDQELTDLLGDAGLTNPSVFATKVASHGGIVGIDQDLYAETFTKVRAIEMQRLAQDCYQNWTASCGNLHLLAADELFQNPLIGLGMLIGLLPTVKSSAKNLLGVEFEDFLQKELPFGRKVGEMRMPDGSSKPRDFDGAYIRESDGADVLIEAKSGGYWEKLQADPNLESKFKTQMGYGAKVASANGYQYELHSNSPIPKHIKDWLFSKSIGVVEYD
ncbi:hypothetical protein [Aliiroseovarius crassostreae]|uniref:hypothetical protein n=1 Tax=Aliiroseovarius crassostreae TaxID=154981 RepID=UPI003C7B2749